MTSVITFPSVREIESLKQLKISINSPETKADAEKQLARIRLASKNLKVDKAAAKKPYKDAIDAIDEAAKQWENSLASQDQAFESALLTYNQKERQRIAAANVKALDKFETKVTTKQAEAIANNTAMPIIAPPVLKTEPQKTVHLEEARLTESGSWTWDGIAGVSNGQKGAKDLTFTESKRLGLDLPEDWFVLDTANITACVKRQDRVPKCVLTQFQERIVVTATK